MRFTLNLSRLAVVPALLALAACGTDTGAPNTDDQQINLDVAHYAADATTDDIVLMTTEADVTMQPGFQNNNGCARQGLFRIRCARKRFHDNVDFTREVTFYDENGDEQEFFDSDSTESINIVASFDGSRSRQNLSVTVDRDRDMTVSGLLGTETTRIWNGTGSASANRTRTSDENGDRTYDMSSNSTVEDVVIAVPRAGTWPLSGTITREITVEVVRGLEDMRTRTRTVVIDFDGTQFATITINGDVFEFDLETRTVVRDDEGDAG